MSYGCGRSLSLRPTLRAISSRFMAWGIVFCREFVVDFKMSRKVLIVEDADFCSATLEIALVKVPGLVIEFAATAEHALKLLATGDVSALITDIHLPRMD